MSSDPFDQLKTCVRLGRLTGGLLLIVGIAIVIIISNETDSSRNLFAIFTVSIVMGLGGALQLAFASSADNYHRTGVIQMMVLGSVHFAIFVIGIAFAFMGVPRRPIDAVVCATFAMLSAALVHRCRRALPAFRRSE